MRHRGLSCSPCLLVCQRRALGTEPALQVRLSPQLHPLRSSDTHNRPGHRNNNNNNLECTVVCMVVVRHPVPCQRILVMQRLVHTRSSAPCVTRSCVVCACVGCGG